MKTKDKNRKIPGWIWTVVRLLVVFIIFFFLFKWEHLDPGQLKDALGNPFSFLLGFIFILMSCALSAERWRKLLQAQDIRISYFDAMKLMFIGMFFSTVIPGSVSGDIVKAYYVVRGRDKKTEAVMTILLDRVLGLYTMVCVAGMVFLLAWGTSLTGAEDLVRSDGRFRILAWFIGVIFVAMTGVFAVASSATLRNSRFTHWILEHIPFKKTVWSLYEAVYTYRNHPRESLLALLYSFITQAPLYAGLYMMARTLNIEGLPVGAYLFIFPVGLMVNALPVLPGGWGQGEAGFEWLFRLFYSSGGAEVAFLFHVIIIVIAVGIGGLIYLFGKKEYRTLSEPDANLAVKWTRINEFLDRQPGRRGLIVGAIVFAILGALALSYFNAFEFSSRTKYHADLTQSPHWVAYHNNSFHPDDILVRYGRYNETPVQNLIYWIGTWFIDVVPLQKYVSIVIFGMTSALFFLLVTRTSGFRTGVFAALFFIIFPRSAYEIGGGYSKAWSIGFLTLTVYLIEQRHWRILIWAMPLAAVAYPVTPVLMGATVAVGLVMEFPRSIKQALKMPGLKFLVIGSVLALIPLMYKYFTPPDFIGNMVPAAELIEQWEEGISGDAPLPLDEEILSYIKEPFFILGALLIFIMLFSKGPVWKRSWSALAIASTICFLVAAEVAPRLYLPDRYTRYSIAVLLVLWHAHNWERVLELFRYSLIKWIVLVAIAVVAALSFPDTFRECTGRQSQGLWEDFEDFAPISEAVAALPEPLLVAGHPTVTANIMLQARRPVLTIHRMYHRWFDKYKDTIDQRHRDTFLAFYARDPAIVNRLVSKYGVTHLVVSRSAYRNDKRISGRVYKREYDAFIRSIARGDPYFVLNPPPKDAVLYKDFSFYLVRLPLVEK